MPVTTWLIQESRHPTETVRALVRACQAQNQPFVSVPIVPFSPEMPSIDAAPPFVFYGYTTLITNAWTNPLWRSGVFYDPDLFRPSAYQEGWGRENMVSDFEFSTLRDLNKYWAKRQNDRLFVKPNDDLKRFSGGVMDFDAWSAWFQSVETLDGDGDVSPETTAAFVSPIENIGPEFRVFLVDGQAVAASSYLPHGGVPPPPEVLEYAEARARDWQPAPVFVLDIAYLEEGKNPLRIVEANCFNGSSFYRADAGAIVRAVSAYQETQC